MPCDFPAINKVPSERLYEHSHISVMRDFRPAKARATTSSSLALGNFFPITTAPTTCRQFWDHRVWFPVKMRFWRCHTHLILRYFMEMASRCGNENTIRTVLKLQRSSHGIRFVHYDSPQRSLYSILFRYNASKTDFTRLIIHGPGGLSGWRKTTS